MSSHKSVKTYSDYSFCFSNSFSTKPIPFIIASVLVTLNSSAQLCILCASSLVIRILRFTFLGFSFGGLPAGLIKSSPFNYCPCNIYVIIITALAIIVKHYFKILQTKRSFSAPSCLFFSVQVKLYSVKCFATIKLLIDCISRFYLTIIVCKIITFPVNNFIAIEK